MNFVYPYNLKSGISPLHFMVYAAAVLAGFVVKCIVNLKGGVKEYRQFSQIRSRGREGRNGIHGF